MGLCLSRLLAVICKICFAQNTFNIAVHGNWSEWSEWDACPVTCGGSEQRRSRNCDNPSPEYGGNDCTGESEEFRPCNELPCAGIIILSVLTYSKSLYSHSDIQ